MLWYPTKHGLAASTCQVEARIQPAWQVANPVVEELQNLLHFVLGCCVIITPLALLPCPPSFPPVTCLPKEMTHLSGWWAFSSLILLPFTVNNKVAFFFFFFLIHQCLVNFVSMSLHSWVQSKRSGMRVCEVHQGKCYLEGICWSGLLDFPGDAHPWCHASCGLSIPHVTRMILPR